jgi:hypothetical protein
VPSLDSTRSERSTGGPAIVDRIVAAYAEVLGDESLGEDADFFAAGGNSLLAVELSARLVADAGIDVPLAFLFMYPTPSELAAVVQSQESGAPAG